MKILIVGTGVIGTIYGWALAQGGHEVTHFVRRGKAQRLAHPVIIDIRDHRRGRKKAFVGKYTFRLTETLSVDDGFEVVVVPTKPYQLEDALRDVVPRTGPADYLLLTQNWQGTEAIDAILPRSCYVYGDAKAGGTFKGDTLLAALFPNIDVGQTDGHSGTALDKVARLFAGIGIRPTIQANILHFIWIQYAINAGLWPALVRASNLDALLRDRRTSDLALRAVKECLDVVEARGVRVDQYPEARMFCHNSAVMRLLTRLAMTAMFRFNASIQRTSAHALSDPREIELAYGDLVKTGADFGMEMPVMRSFEADIVRFCQRGEA